MKYYYSEKEKIIYTGVMGVEDREATQEEVDNHFGTDLESLRKKKIEEFKATRNEKESGGFEYKGKILDSDALSCQRISGANNAAVAALLTNSDFPVVPWSCSDNTTLSLDARGVIDMAVALAGHSANQHVIYGELKTQVETATTKEELASIKWPEG